MKRPSRRTIVITVAAVAVVAALAGAGWLWARGVVNVARAGKSQVEAGAKSLAAQDATAAAAQFADASKSFERTRSMLGPDWLAAATGWIPLAGPQYTTARELATIGLDGSNAGTQLAIALQKAPAASESTTSTTKLAALLTTGRPHVQAALDSLSDAADRAAKLPDSGLVPQLADAVSSVKATLGGAAPILARSHALLTLEKYLFSSDHKILVVSQDSAELRPTGGFAGSFGIVNVGPRGVTLDKYSDVYELPTPAVKVHPPPGATFISNFTFHDANWWIDFPTSATTMLERWAASRQPKVDSIVVIDTAAVKDLLAVVGPIRVPSYNETFTSKNLLERLLYHTQIDAPASVKGRKGVLVALATELEKRLLNASPGELARAGLALAKAADGKHVQMYFPNAEAQAAVVELGWSGKIAPPAGATDMLVVANAMNKGAKINMAMSKTIDYGVALATDGSAATKLVLGYSNIAPFNIPGRTQFRDYLRVYRAPGTVFTHTPASDASGGSVTTELGFPVAIRQFRVSRGETYTVTITSRVPAAVRIATTRSAPLPTGIAVAGAVSHYRLFVVRQADIQDVPTKLTITAPPGQRVTGVGAWKTASGEVVPSTWDGGTARVSVPLSGDMIVDVGLAPR
jgi:hypothetical protein